ncbi:uncharacterized protein LOC122036026 [Zingiber officinale]|uniref:uncharacterized protein LOC122036026 n=1 Tax=Zingiber officinale TaxID=94328 RepID=UPI001C4DB1BC|nr:uncharacterized protein LOC122036026 [Zingiber officinale]
MASKHYYFLLVVVALLLSSYLVLVKSDDDCTGIACTDEETCFEACGSSPIVRCVSGICCCVHVATTTAVCLKEAIDSLFAKYGLSVARLRVQGYDGASNMSGEFNGLKSLIMKENLYALYVIDIILQEIDSRFSETTTDLLIYMSCIDPWNSFSRFDVQKLVRLVHFYEDDFSWNERMLVEQELETYIDDVRSDEQFEGISDLGALTKKMIETMKNRVFPLVYRILELALLLPVATTTVERVFLAMNIVKTRLEMNG